MGFLFAKARAAGSAAILALLLSCLANGSSAAGAGPHYTGRVLYRGTKTPVAGVLVELVAAENDGKPTDEVLGSIRADAEGRFAIAPAESTGKPVALVISAVRETADSGGDRSSEGYDVKTHRTELGFLPFPSPAKSNTVFVERRRAARSDGN